MSRTVVQKMVWTSFFNAFGGSQRCIGLARRSSEGNLDSSVLRQRKGASTFSSEGSNFQGNFRNRVFLGGVKFPKEFLETWARAKPSAAVPLGGGWRCCGHSRTTTPDEVMSNEPVIM